MTGESDDAPGADAAGAATEPGEGGDELPVGDPNWGPQPERTWATGERRPAPPTAAETAGLAAAAGVEVAPGALTCIRVALRDGEAETTDEVLDELRTEPGIVAVSTDVDCGPDSPDAFDLLLAPEHDSLLSSSAISTLDPVDGVAFAAYPAEELAERTDAVLADGEDDDPEPDFEEVRAAVEAAEYDDVVAELDGVDLAPSTDDGAADDGSWERAGPALDEVDRLPADIGAEPDGQESTRERDDEEPLDLGETAGDETLDLGEPAGAESEEPLDLGEPDDDESEEPDDDDGEESLDLEEPDDDESEEPLDLEEPDDDESEEPRDVGGSTDDESPGPEDPGAKAETGGSPVGSNGATSSKRSGLGSDRSSGPGTSENVSMMMGHPAGPGPADADGDLEPEAVLSALLEALDQRPLREDELATLRGAMGFSSPESLTARVDHLGNQVNELLAYREELATFIDETDGGRQLLELESAVEELSGRVAAVEELADRLDEVVELTGSLEEELDRQSSQLAMLSETVAEREDQIADIRETHEELRERQAELAETQSDLAAELDEMEADLTALTSWRDRLQTAADDPE